MEAKLAAFRAQKAAERLKVEKRKKVWSLLTFEGLRNRLGRGAQGDDLVDTHPEQELEEEFIEEAPVPWTKIDWIILAVKALIWFCFQLIFAKLEFGAVFFATSCFAIIYLYGMGTTRKRDPTNLSAYSVFNPNCQTIQGTLTGEQFDKEIRHQLPTSR